jgi:hypothetical protein
MANVDLAIVDLAIVAMAIVAMAIVAMAIVDIDRGTKYLYGPGCRSLSGDHDTKVP